MTKVVEVPSFMQMIVLGSPEKLVEQRVSMSLRVVFSEEDWRGEMWREEARMGVERLRERRREGCILAVVWVGGW